MNADADSTEVPDGYASVDRIADDLRTAYGALSGALTAPEGHLADVVAAAERLPPPERPPRRARMVAAVRGWLASRWTGLLAPGSQVMRTGGQPARNEAWLEELWRVHHDDLYRYLARRVDDPSIVDDLVQQTFMAAWRQRGEAHLNTRAWLFGVARNVARGYWRDRQRDHRVLRQDLAEASLSNDGGIGEAELSMAVDRAWRRLTKLEQETLLLSVNYDWSDSDIADYLRTSRANVRQRRRRARGKLHAALGDLSAGQGVARPGPAA